jgi:hypothetical protein
MAASEARYRSCGRGPPHALTIVDAEKIYVYPYFAWVWVKAYTDAHLDDPDLGPESVAAGCETLGLIFIRSMSARHRSVPLPPGPATAHRPSAPGGGRISVACATDSTGREASPVPSDVWPSVHYRRAAFGAVPHVQGEVDRCLA